MRLNPFGGTRRSRQADAVVIGAGSGIGRAVAVELGRRGGRVICADADTETTRETVDLVEEAGGTGLEVACDVTRIEQVSALADIAEQWFGAPPGIVCNSAEADTAPGVVGSIPLSEWHQLAEVNIWGAIHGCHVFVPRLCGAGRGTIVNTASAAAFGATPRTAPYNVTKAAVISLSETLSAELSGTGVSVTVLCPALGGGHPEPLARAALDAVDSGTLYALPQVEARLLWQSKRLIPGTYTRALGMLDQLVR
ncbi:SDR family NAD(P)-dependent oxidoreductase [Nocardia stercoris]|uniref:SDR family NAD(P)-dependent oxidoreductase n=1 Tax=Nocardia stercoris TaxID=2483361 RepID=A0A3M2LAP9_9NOCA|nr:SDR family NAD(P)-dependent oxidoreductase [Nocardia stercoris]RMI31678.1 SDR family NAD(P)-dependent oxidoreductase [Nocardia stercoris]